MDDAQEEPLYALTTALAADGHEVHLLTSGEMIARRVAFVSRIGVLRRLDEAGVTVHTGVVPVGVVDGSLRIAHVLSRRLRELGPVATVVRGGPLEAPPLLDTGGRQTLVIGDASAPRSYVASGREGYDAGLAITELPLPA
ncbi:hypothetical protein [Thermocatellispora tengchongensis]|uniref:hypothetical protein n=1 Tax=Thermocatellispora tengchongensis TaxID=1073253 RepID=UPI0036284C52